MSERLCQIMTSHSASVNSKERSSAALMLLKIAVLASRNFDIRKSCNGTVRDGSSCAA
jgi:hypothetical protein